MVNDGYVNPQDNRMLPNTFEGVTLKGVVGPVGYHVGYLWDIKPRNSEDFISMSQQAGAAGDDEGLLLTSVTLTPWKALNVFLGNYYVPEVFNTGFGKIQYTQPLAGDLAMQLGVQYTDQRSIGDERLGDFVTWNVGLGVAASVPGAHGGPGDPLHGGRRLDPVALRHVARIPLDDPDRLRPGRRDSLGHRGQVRLRRDLDPLAGARPERLPRLRPGDGPGRPRDRERPPDDREGDLDVIYNVPAVKGLQFRLRNAYVDEGGDRVGYQVRLILNYLVDLL